MESRQSSLTNTVIASNTISNNTLTSAVVGMGAKIDHLNGTVEARVGKVETKMEVIETKIDGLFVRKRSMRIDLFKRGLERNKKLLN